MREIIDHKLAMLVTSDAGVERAAIKEAGAHGDKIELFHDGKEALSEVICGSGDEKFAIVDLAAGPSGRHLLQTAAGVLPVLVISAKPSSWLTSLRRRRRVGAVLMKPFSQAEWHDAFRRVRGLSKHVGRCWV